MGALHGLAWALVTCAGTASAAGQAAGDDRGSIAGVWVNADYKTSARYSVRDGAIKAADGKDPPLQPWAATLLAKRIKDAEEGNPFATTKSMCLPGGVPQVMFGPRLPIEFLVSGDKVTMLIEEFNNFRQIFLGQKHPEDPDPSFMGHSVGHWEGQTLVVDTIGLTDRTTLDPIGTPHSDQLHLVERIRRIAPDRLEDVVTFDDPGAFTRPWTARTTFEAVPQLRVAENICENNRNGPAAGGGQKTGAVP